MDEDLKEFKHILENTIPLLFPPPDNTPDPDLSKYNTPSVRAVDYLHYLVTQENICIDENKDQLIKDEKTGDDKNIELEETNIFPKSALLILNEIKSSVQTNLDQNTALCLFRKIIKIIDSVYAMTKRRKQLALDRLPCTETNIPSYATTIEKLVLQTDGDNLRSNTEDKLTDKIKKLIDLLRSETKPNQKLKGADKHELRLMEITNLVRSNYLSEADLNMLCNYSLGLFKYNQMLTVRLYFCFFNNNKLHPEIIDCLESFLFNQKINSDFLEIFNKFRNIKNERIVAFSETALKRNYGFDLNLKLILLNNLRTQVEPITLMRNLVELDERKIGGLAFSVFARLRIFIDALVVGNVFNVKNYWVVCHEFFGGGGIELFSKRLGVCGLSRAAVATYVVFCINELRNAKKNRKTKRDESTKRQENNGKLLITSYKNCYNVFNRVMEMNKNGNLNIIAEEEIIYKGILDVANTKDAFKYLCRAIYMYCLKMLQRGLHRTKRDESAKQKLESSRDENSDYNLQFISSINNKMLITIGKSDLNFIDLSQREKQTSIEILKELFKITKNTKIIEILEKMKYNKIKYLFSGCVITPTLFPILLRSGHRIAAIDSYFLLLKQGYQPNNNLTVKEIASRFVFEEEKSIAQYFHLDRFVFEDNFLEDYCQAVVVKHCTFYSDMEIEIVINLLDIEKAKNKKNIKYYNTLMDIIINLLLKRNYVVSIRFYEDSSTMVVNSDKSKFNTKDNKKIGNKMDAGNENNIQINTKENRMTNAKKDICLENNNKRRNKKENLENNSIELVKNKTERKNINNEKKDKISKINEFTKSKLVNFCTQLIYYDSYVIKCGRILNLLNEQVEIYNQNIYTELIKKSCGCMFECKLEIAYERMYKSGIVVENLDKTVLYDEMSYLARIDWYDENAIFGSVNTFKSILEFGDVDNRNWALKIIFRKMGGESRKTDEKENTEQNIKTAKKRNIKVEADNSIKHESNTNKLTTKLSLSELYFSFVSSNTSILFKLVKIDNNELLISLYKLLNKATELGSVLPQLSIPIIIEIKSKIETINIKPMAKKYYKNVINCMQMLVNYKLVNVFYNEIKGLEFIVKLLNLLSVENAVYVCKTLSELNLEVNEKRVATKKINEFVVSIPYSTKNRNNLRIIYMVLQYKMEMENGELEIEDIVSLEEDEHYFRVKEWVEMLL